MLVATKEFTSALVTINQDMELLKLLELNTISKELDSKSLWVSDSRPGSFN